MTQDHDSPRVLVAADELSVREGADVALTDQAAEGDLAVTARLRAGDLELDESRWTVHRAGRQVELTPTEFRLLICLMSNQGQVVTREQILHNVWGQDKARRLQIVDTYIGYLRRKLDSLGPRLIHTRRGVGYSLPPRAVPPID
jgi:DNA-binding response OmpR family regulator